MDGPGWRAGSRFGPYEMRELLGRGGTGEVYEAYDTARGRVVAVKVLDPEFARDPAYRERFRREARAGSALADPHVVPINDAGEIAGVLYIDMGLVPGADLGRLLREQGPMAPQRAVGIIAQIAAALDAAHAAGMVHRDVKPANILVTDTDFAYLADFGLAHTEGDSTVTQVGMAAGSYVYMAPERFNAGEVTGLADVYSLGCVLHECLTGAVPFPALSTTALIRSHLTEAPPRASVAGEGIPAALDAVIARALAKAPEDRFPGAGALARAAEEAVRGPAQQPAPTFVVRTPDPATFGRTEPAPTSAIVPPEATGEMTVIRPTAATSIHPTEIQFSPLPDTASGAMPVVGPAGGTPQAPVPMRPFPDAHLYPEEQRYSETAPPVSPPARTPPAAPAYPAVAPPDPTPAYREPAQPVFSPPTERFEPVAAPLDAYASGARSPQRYPIDREDERSHAADPGDLRSHAADAYGGGSLPYAADSYPAEPYPADPYGDDPYGAPDRHAGAYPPDAQGGEYPYGQAYSDYHPEPPRGHGEGHPADPYVEQGYTDPYGAQPYGADHDGYAGEFDEGRPARRRSALVPVLLAVVASAVVAVGGVVGWTVLRPAPLDSQAFDQAAATATTSAARAVPPATSSGSAPTTSGAATSSVALPASAKPCATGRPAPGSFTQAAAGNDMTSCPFAEAVRAAYTASAAASSRGARTVVAVSPVTGRSYTMNCVSESGAADPVVTCSGGENAVVYIY